jgi:hypothetical protein
METPYGKQPAMIQAHLAPSYYKSAAVFANKTGGWRPSPAIRRQIGGAMVNEDGKLELYAVADALRAVAEILRHETPAIPCGNLRSAGVD